MLGWYWSQEPEPFSVTPTYEADTEPVTGDITTNFNKCCGRYFVGKTRWIYS